MKEILRDKKIIFLVFLIILMVFLILLFTLLTKKTVTNQQQKAADQTIETTNSSPRYQRPTGLPVDLKSIPTLIPQEGKGLDLQSQPIVDSISEIAKIKGKLPFIKTVNSGDIEVKIVIPERKYQDNDYVIFVNLNGIDFQSPSDGNTYFENRKAFVVGATEVFNWLKENNVDIKKIIIKWGDKASVNDKANVWLNYVKI